MKYLYQAGILFLFTLLGEALAHFIPLPVPAAIWGLVLLFAALCTGIVKPERIRECSAFLVSLLPVLFVAPTVALTEQAEALAADLPQVIVIVAVSTVLTLLVSGRVTQRLRRRAGEGEEHD